MNDAYETRDITRNGRTYRVEFCFDGDTGRPWKAHDGHGIVSEWTTRAKRPGEVIIVRYRDSRRYYDIEQTRDIALRDGWGMPEAWIAKYRAAFNREPSKREIAMAATRADMKRMRAWCNDEWHWSGVCVFPLSAAGDELRSQSQSLWGIESDAGDYFDQVIAELIDQIEAEHAHG